MSEHKELIAEARHYAGADEYGGALLLRELANALEAVTAPRADDREELAALIDDEYDGYVPRYSQDGRCIDSTLAQSIINAGFHRGAPQADEEYGVRHGNTIDIYPEGDARALALEDPEFYELVWWVPVRQNEEEQR